MQQLPLHPQFRVPHFVPGQVHVPLVQLYPVVVSHTVPHVPQLLSSLVVSVHVPAQTLYGAAHVHVPDKHEYPVPQGVQFAPQCVESLLVS
jgi:hypothetical protein